ncbi:cell wall-binding protein [Clostridium chromiireducens]|uniref:cell wall-binding protein n=1 Tax=Clostridium chromiireducens TaxID=225345 RepID=UPI003AF5F9AB
MLKRSTKIISLLIAAVSVVTTIPVIATENSNKSLVSTTAATTNSQVKTIEAEDGTVNNARAYGNGIFLVDGYKSENDDTAINYVSDDGKFNKIDDKDIESGDTLGDLLQGQYIEIDNSTYIDTKNNYKVVNDNIRETMVNNAATKLKKNVKKDNDGRFDSNCVDNTIKAYAKNPVSTSTFLGGTTGIWSHYKYKLTTPYISGEQYSTIYADTAGNYIDGDYNLGSIKVSTEATTGASVTIKNTEDTYEIKDNGTTYELRAAIKEDTTYINEQKDELRRAAYITIYKKIKGEPDSDFKPATSELYFGDDNNNRHKITSGDSARVFQIFSKEAASNTVDGIKYPKKSDIYFLTDEDGKSEALLGLGGKSKISGVGNGVGAIIFNAVKGFTSVYADKDNNRLYVERFKPTQKNGYRYIDIDDYKESDMNGKVAFGAGAGEVICLDGNYLKIWSGTNFDKLYKIDGSLNSMNLGNKDNIILWNADKGTYSIIYNKTQAQVVASAQTSSNTVTTTTSVQAGWIKNEDASWSYKKKDGSKAIGWIQSATNKQWYYMDDNGIMIANKWIKNNEKWYFLREDGAMATGWIENNRVWYYLDSSGVMLSNTTVDGFILGIDGAWIQ